MPYGPRNEADGVPDGMKIDSEGRVFSTGPGGVWVWEPDGSPIGLIKLPELPANLGWGGADRRTMYVTARTSVYSLRVRTPGLAAS
jgi:gluconolactonase